MPTDNEVPNPDGAYWVYNAHSLGRAIRHYRHEAGLTQAELAERTGIPREYIVAMEQGLETEQLRRLFRVIKSFGLGITLQRREW